MGINLRWIPRRAFSMIFGPLVRYASEEYQQYNLDTALYELTTRRALASSLDYAEKNMATALVCKGYADLWSYAIKKVSVDGLCVEFGVWKGRSINYFAKRLPVVYGFDSFEGLQEDWSGWLFAKGAFDVKGKLPKVPNNVHLIKGWFNDTLPQFLAAHRDCIAFAHIDCDTGESARFVLQMIEERLVPGSVIVFDEYFGYRGWSEGGEFKAWSECVRRTGKKYEYLAFSSQQVAVRLTSA